MFRKIIFLIILLLFSSPLIHVQENLKAYIIPVKGVIDLGLSGFIKRALNEARQDNASTVILEIDTFGGRVDAVLDIAKYLEENKPYFRTVAFIKDQAWSAGALVALACKEIFMSPNATIGSAEPRAIGIVQQNELTDEKVVSSIRAKFKAVAESNAHSGNLALAMVDKDTELKLVEVKGKKEILTASELEQIERHTKKQEIKIIKVINLKGKLLNLTAFEAKELGLAKEILSDRAALLKYLNLTPEQTSQINTNWSERLVRIITHPLISPLLLMFGILGIIYELKIPGWGISGTLGLLCLGLFFWGHYLVGLANWTEILIFILGIALLTVEIFFIPGFGIVGALGILLALSGLFLALIKHPFKIPAIQLKSAFYSFSLSLIGIALGIPLFLRLLGHSNIFKKIILSSQEKKEQGFRTGIDLKEYLNKEGRSLTILRPAGKAVFEDKILDVITEGEFIENNKPVRVVDIKENKLIVEEIKDA